MAFPSTSILTSFTGADEEPLSGGGAWASTLRTASASIDECRLVSNQAGPTTVGTVVGESVWNTSYAEDQEVYATLNAFPTSTGSIALFARVQGNGTTATLNAYLINYVHSTTTIEIEKVVNGTFTTLGSPITQALVAGNKLGLQLVGSNPCTITGWYFTSGAWSTVAGIQASDSSVDGAGKLGLSISKSGSSGRVDDFSGGASGQIILPDADNATGGWTTSPLFSKLNDSSDSTLITATAA